ncbi:cobalamin B12-binding domain-containing protein [Bacillus pinisoli]|uniref:cobalamin B12-binding domain-containing protein n=1 Tax=Bacillus pinisoli TaxID=2901866 RepID=UPI001FF5ACD1|nr:cobalamin-dependent protein [Bacillus pinisoli]
MNGFHLHEFQLKKLVELMLEANDNKAWQLISSWMNEREDSLFFYEYALAEAMRYVGELWELNEITVADEHIASNVCNLLIARYHVEISNRLEDHTTESSLKGMFFCIEGEEHSLGIRMVTSLFKEYGWNTRYLGANLPVKDAVIYATKWRPEIIGVSLSIIYNLPKLMEFLSEMDKLDYRPEILVGGRITTLFELESHLPKNIRIVKELDSLNHMLQHNELCKELHVIS